MGSLFGALAHLVALVEQLTAGSEGLRGILGTLSGLQPSASLRGLAPLDGSMA
jgi:hypothetical protein